MSKLSLALIGLCLTSSVNAYAGKKLLETEYFTYEVGLRMQPRFELKDIGNDVKKDFLVRRTRFKANGHLLKCNYKIEWKIDNVDQIDKVPTPQVENAWIQCPVVDDYFLIKAGLFDAPYSRDRMISDEKQITVDRGIASDDISNIGMADNTTGVTLSGVAFEGLFQYAVGAYDNRKLGSELQDRPMFIGRLDLNLGSVKNIYRDAHFSKDDWWLSFGFNAGHLGGVEETASTMRPGVRNAIGGDFMVDVPVGPIRILARGEVNGRFVRDHETGEGEQKILWMAGVGLLLFDVVQPSFRIDQEFRSFNNDTAVTTYINPGVNLYYDQHNLKLQIDLIKRLQEGGTGNDLDVIRVQAGINF